MDAHDWARWAAERARNGPQAVLDELASEIAMEKATTLARLGRRLDDVVARLAALRADPGDRSARITADRAARAELHELRWEMTVVKEAMGLRGVRAEIDRYWPMPRPLE